MYIPACRYPRPVAGSRPPLLHSPAISAVVCCGYRGNPRTATCLLATVPWCKCHSRGIMNESLRFPGPTHHPDWTHWILAQRQVHNKWIGKYNITGSDLYNLWIIKTTFAIIVMMGTCVLGGGGLLGQRRHFNSITEVLPKLKFTHCFHFRCVRKTRPENCWLQYSTTDRMSVNTGRPLTHGTKHWKWSLILVTNNWKWEILITYHNTTKPLQPVDWYQSDRNALSIYYKHFYNNYLCR